MEQVEWTGPKIHLSYFGTIYSKKNSKQIITNRRTGKPQIVSNPNAKVQETIMANIFCRQAQKGGWPIFDKKLAEYRGREFEIDIKVFQFDRRRRDLDNQITAILDGLVAAKVIPDDSNEFVQKIVATSEIDRTNPRAEITIKERVKDDELVVEHNDGSRLGEYTSLAELNEEWEDYEEPEEHWYINELGKVEKAPSDWLCNERDCRQEIGNYFDTREEAEKAVEKSKAITRLKSCRFKFKGWRTADLGADKYYFVITAESDGAGKGDLDLLFGGEE